MDVAANLTRKALLHAPLVVCAGVLEAERHSDVAEGTKWCDECRFLFVLDRHLDLVVSRVRVEEAQ